MIATLPRPTVSIVTEDTVDLMTQVTGQDVRRFAFMSQEYLFKVLRVLEMEQDQFSDDNPDYAVFEEAIAYAYRVYSYRFE